jgi:hypothetical protein
MGKAFICPEKVQTTTNMYILALVEDCFWHTNCTSHILSYLLGELGDKLFPAE